MRRHGEGQAHGHAAGIAFDGDVDVLFDLGECHDLVELAGDLLALHAENGPVEVDILPARQVRVEPNPHLQHGTDLAEKPRFATGWRSHPGQDFEQCAFTRSVGTDNAHHLTLTHLQRDIIQRPKQLPIPSRLCRENRMPHPLTQALGQAFPSFPPLVGRGVRAKRPMRI